MTLSALIRKREIATATVATPATPQVTVAKVASVAVANPLLTEEETAIRTWLAYIEETDPATITNVITQCQTDAQARFFFLEQARKPPPDYTATCWACKHFQRINHSNLGHCAQGEPEDIAGLWDTTRRWCIKYEGIEHD